MTQGGHSRMKHMLQSWRTAGAEGAGWTYTLMLTRRDVQASLGYDDCIAWVEQAFRLHAEGRSLAPGVLGVRAPAGGFHIKAAGLQLGRLYFAVQTNGNF